MTLINDRTREAVAVSVELAHTRRERRKGLLGRESLPPENAMVLSPCNGVHTVGMAFAIDVVFVNAEGYAVQVIHEMRPWRFAVSLKASSVIELAGGRLKTCPVQIGDRLRLVANGQAVC